MLENLKGFFFLSLTLSYMYLIHSDSSPHSFSLSDLPPIFLFLQVHLFQIHDFFMVLFCDPFSLTKVICATIEL